jgi:hypothetical protein
MKVKELLEVLQAQDPEMEVVLSKDGEGNNFSPYDGWSVGYYLADSTWSGEFSSDEHIEEASPDDYEEFYADAKENGVRAVCLWPTN